MVVETAEKVRHQQARVLSDKQLVKDIVGRARADSQRFSGAYTAHFLLNPISKSVWTLSNGQRYSFNISLPDGSSLTSPANSRMFDAFGRFAFLARLMPDVGVNTDRALIGFLQATSNIVRWLYMNADRYSPATHAFSRLNTRALQEMLDAYGKGGVAWMLHCHHRFLAKLYLVVLGRPTPASVVEDVFSVPEADRTAFISWLEMCGAYRPSVHGVGQFLSRRFVADLVGVDLHVIKAQKKLSALLRQFEPTVTSPLLVTRECRREHPSIKTPTLAEVQGSAISGGERYLQVFSAMCVLHRHLPDVLPSSTWISLAEARAAHERASKAPGHTPWMPLPVALQFTKESLRWVHVYGEGIIDHYIRCVEAIAAAGYFNAATRASPRRARDRICNELIQPAAIRPLNVVGWGTIFSMDATAYQNFRETPSINDALSVLIGAICSLVGFLKPIRESELEELDVACIEFCEGDGYWLKQTVAKGLVAGTRIEAKRPIPRVVAKALDLVLRLRSGLERVSKQTFGSRLFVIPDRDIGDKLLFSDLTEARLNAYLDRFSAFVNPPPDNLGRRWVVREHIARKSFLITLFWCFRFQSLELGRWMACHVRERDLFSYIEANFPGEELPLIKAEYAAMQLWSLSDTGECEAVNADELYKLACRRFRVSQIALIDSDKLKEWLATLVREDRLDVTPVQAFDLQAGGAIDICFRIGPKRARRAA